MNYVVGSGPSGVAAAAALVGRGLPVTMLDAGGDLEPDLEERVLRLRRGTPESWTPSDVEALRGPLRYNGEGAPLKLIFGSDYPYRDADIHQPIERRQVDAYQSLANGGLSVLWGASVLPYSDEELRGWPIQAEQLRAHYAAVLGLTGLAAEHDELESLYPLVVEPSAHLTASAQARVMLDELKKNAKTLAERKIFFGKSRLAIGPPAKGSAVKGCVYCGLCLYGCPYGLIYSSRSTSLEVLARSPNFKYSPGFIVRNLRKKSDGQIEIEAVSRALGESVSFTGSKVFLAAGVFSSTRIVLRALGMGREQGVRLRQSDHFLVPMLLSRRAGDTSKERLHTLSQIFLELRDPAVSKQTVHLQVYTYSDFYARMARDKLGPLYRVSTPILNRLFDRFVVIKGYLHSDESASIRASLQDSSLKLEAVANPNSENVVRSVLKVLAKNRKYLGASPIRSGYRMGLPGSGVHVGGAFPMSISPSELQSDLLGRPAGLSNVHVVDASVFPTVPAPTITLTAMANAHRIASHAGGP